MSNNLEQSLKNNPHNIPTFLSGHWESDSGFNVALEYAEYSEKNLCMGALSDQQIADGLKTSGPIDLKLIAWQTAAKERIRWLSVKLAIEKQVNPEKYYPIAEDVSRTILLMNDLSDLFIANAQFMASRDSPHLYDLKLAAAERIVWLSKQLGRT